MPIPASSSPQLNTRREEIVMTTNWLHKIARAVVAVVVLLGGGAYMHAQDGCTAKDLKGGFGFQLTGVNTALGGIRFAISGRFEANGSGQFSGAGTESVEGHVGQI